MKKESKVVQFPKRMYPHGDAELWRYQYWQEPVKRPKEYYIGTHLKIIQGDKND